MEAEKKKQDEKAKKKKKAVASVSKKKIETVKSLVELMKNNSTLILASIKNLPSRQFQEIRKNLRGKAKMIVAKKRIMIRAIDDPGNKNLERLKEYICEDSSILFSKEDAFELAGIMAENKNPVRAKPGQKAIEDISVEAGPTEILPGPAISEFSSIGIPISVEDGKIAIRQGKVIVKAGEEISNAAASIMSKLNIMPFRVGLEPIAICNIKTGQIYLNVKIDREATLTELKTAAAKSLGFAQKIAYYCKETIGYLLAKANMDGKAIESKTQASTTQTETKPEDN
ncbi:50S ribosomal protein L10 [Candidatus Pacearchaeota archaeon RBG_13_36_9]|nr:MAG: 50S ribosomal protein L10 [Candidatus Pacearchaeota archaeon RBG_13_36_9]